MRKILVTALLLLLSCNNIDPDLKNVNFREEMRTFVGEISVYAKNQDPDFIIVPQNGVELVTLNSDPEGQVATLYLDKIDAVGQEDLFYGYEADNQKTSVFETNHLIPFLELIQDNGKAILVTDYCFDPSKMDDSYVSNNQKSFISFAAPKRELNIIPSYPPSPRDSNERNILTINDASNFLYLLNPENYTSKNELLFALANSNYDIIIMDAFYEGQPFMANELETIKTKYNGGSRLLLGYMSIGEAEDYRYYWDSGFRTAPPDWLSDPNPEWPGNYKVKYWKDSWKLIILGTDNAYLDKLIYAGFDGVYLDIIDAYEYFESLR